jgi:hypothetical protein
MALPSVADYAVDVLRDLLGPRTAEAFRELYVGLPTSKIRASFMKVLSEYLGSTEARKEVDHFDAFAKSDVVRPSVSRSSKTR